MPGDFKPGNSFQIRPGEGIVGIILFNSLIIRVDSFFLSLRFNTVHAPFPLAIILNPRDQPREVDTHN